MIEMEMSTVVAKVDTEVVPLDLSTNHLENSAEKTPNHIVRDEVELDEKEKVLIASPVTDDFLTIVPKPTLLSKEKAKKRLLAFGLSKFSNFQNNKKLSGVKNVTKAKINKSLEAGSQKEEVPIVKKVSKKSTHLDAARETVEAIEKCKQEEVDLLLGAKQESRKLLKLRYGNRKRRYNELGDKTRVAKDKYESRVEAKRESRKRSSANMEKRLRDQVKKSFVGPEKRSSHGRDQSSKSKDCRSLPKSQTKEKEKPKEKKSWSDYDDHFCDHPDHNEINHDIVDVRKMLLFNSACYNFKPYQYKKIDGTMATVSAQYLRYTVKSLPRIVYNPNPNNISATFFQRKEVFSIISKPQKDCVMNLISQPKQIPPHKPQTTRNWYSKNYLIPCHEGVPICSAASDTNVEDESVNDDLKSSKRDKSKKTECTIKKHESEDKSKRRKDKKKKHKEEKKSKASRRGPTEDSRLKNEAVNEEEKCKRTDSHKSDTNSSNSIDKATLHNSISSRGVVDEAVENVNSRLKTKTPSTSTTHDPMQVEVDPNTPPLHQSSPILNKYKPCKAGKDHTHDHSADKHVHTTKGDAKVNQEEAKDVRKDADKHNSSQQNHRLHGYTHRDYKSYSKKSSLPPLHPVSSMTKLAPTKIYNIENDCLETANKSFEMPEIAMNYHTQEEPLQTVDNKPKSLTEQYDNIADISETRPVKEVPMEKLKSKPSELYSPTLQSLSADTSDNETEMPDTDEYKSHWESEEELSLLNSSKILNNSWESDDEYPCVAERVIEQRKELTARSLEMPLNINITRQRSQVLLPKETHETKPLMLFEDLDATSSWDLDSKQTSFELKPDVTSYSSGSLKTNLEDEYMQFMSSVFTTEETAEERQRSYSSSSSVSSSSSSSSSSDTYSSSSIEAEASKDKHENADFNTNAELNEIADLKSDYPIRQNDIAVNLPSESSPLCKVDSTSSPAVAFEENKMYVPKPIASIIFPKKSPLVGCSLFKDDSTDNEGSTYGKQRDPSDDRVDKGVRYEAKDLDTAANRLSPSRKRAVGSRSQSGQSSRSRSSSPPNKKYSSNRDRFWDSPLRAHSPRRKEGSLRRDTSPRNKQSNRRSLSPKGSPRRSSSSRRGDLSPRGGLSSQRASPKGAQSPRRLSSPRRNPSQKGRSPTRLPRRALSPRGLSPRRTASPKSRDSSPRRRDNDRREARRRDGASPRRRSPKLSKDNSRSVSPKHDSRLRSPKHRDRSPRSIDLPRHRDYDRDKNRDGDIARHRDERYRDLKYRDGSPRYRESPSRYSPTRRRSPPRHRYSPKSRERSPRYRERSPWRRSTSPPCRMYSRSASKDRKHESITQALHRLAGMEYEPPKSPNRINSPMEGYIRGVPDSTISDEQLMQNRLGDFNSTQSPPVYFSQPPFKTEGSPKRIPLDDRINQVLGIDAPKGSDNINYTNDHYYNHMYYDQYNNMPSNHMTYEHGDYKHYNRHLIDVNNIANKVVQVGNVLQVVPTEQQQLALSGNKKDLFDPVVNTTQLPPDSSQKFVHVGNMLQIVPTAELPAVEDISPEPIAKKEVEDPITLKINERQLERERRRQERDRRRKEKEMKKKEREHQKQLKLKLKSEDMIKKALMIDVNDEAEQESEQTLPVVVSVGTKVTKGILVIHKKNSVPDKEYLAQKQKKGVKFADGVLPGEGTSPSGGEELSSPPPFKEKRYTKTKKPKRKQHKKKIKVKLIRKAKKKLEDDDEDDLPPPSPPPGSPPTHIFPPRVKPNLFNHPSYYPTYQYNVVTCQPMAESPHSPYPNLQGMQYPPISHLPSTQPPPIPIIQAMHPLPLLLQSTPRVMKTQTQTKALDKTI